MDFVSSPTISKKQNAAFLFWILLLWVGKKTSNLIDGNKRPTMCYFLGNSWNRPVKEYFLFLWYLAAVMLCRQVCFLLCVPFLKRNKIVCQILPVYIWIWLEQTLLSWWRRHEFWNNELILWANSSSLSLFVHQKNSNGIFIL